MSVEPFTEVTWRSGSSLPLRNTWKSSSPWLTEIWIWRVSRGLTCLQTCSLAGGTETCGTPLQEAGFYWCIMKVVSGTWSLPFYMLPVTRPWVASATCFCSSDSLSHHRISGYEVRSMNPWDKINLPSCQELYHKSGNMAPYPLTIVWLLNYPDLFC